MAAAAARAGRVLPYFLLACAVLALLVGPLATSVFVLGFIDGDSPCVLCWAQRTSMLLIALVGLFVLRYGPRPRYLGLGLLISAAGIYMGIRHSALHLARDVGQGFSVELYGAHTYTWSIFVFWVCLVAMALLIMLLRDGEASAVSRKLGLLDRLAMPLFIVVVAANIVQAFASTGPPPFMGQSDPIRFSFNPRHWVWSTEEWNPAPVTLRGRWAIEKPHVDGLSPDTDGGPLAGLPMLAVTRQLPVSLPVGAVTDLAYDASTDRFLLTTDTGVWLSNSSLDQVLRRAIVDMAFAVDLARFAGAAFLEPGVVMALSENKSFVILRENPRADAMANYRFFIDGRDQFDEVSRSRLATVRARMMYVLSLAFNPDAGALYTVSVPNQRVQRLIVSRFDRGDLTLSEEFAPTLEPGLPVTLRSKERSLDELYVTGATWHAGRLYAISAAHSTLLVIDPARRRVVAAYGVRGLDRPTGLAVKGNEFYISSASPSVAVVPVPTP